MNSSVKFLEATVSVVPALAGLRVMTLAAAGSSRATGVESGLPPEPPQAPRAMARTSRRGAAARGSMRPAIIPRPPDGERGTRRLLGEAGLFEVALGGF